MQVGVGSAGPGGLWIWRLLRPQQGREGLGRAASRISAEPGRTSWQRLLKGARACVREQLESSAAWRPAAGAVDSEVPTVVIIVITYESLSARPAQRGFLVLPRKEDQ